MKNKPTATTGATGLQPRCASLFSQILNLVDRGSFDAAVARTGAERRTKARNRARNRDRLKMAL
jgi:hypothetical protein